jgi:phosphate transport system substrate-binding protein
MTAPAALVAKYLSLGCGLLLLIAAAGCREEVRHIRSTVKEVRAELEQEKAVVLRGAGATSAEGLLKKVFEEFDLEHPGVRPRYEAVGTGAGVRLFTEEAVDFGVGDQTLSEAQKAEVARGVRIFPMSAWGLALVYNLKDAAGKPVVDLKLSREAYAGIFRGTITRWNDSRLAQHNPGVALPDQPIQVEYRLDESGSTDLLTTHLAKIVPDWATAVGVGEKVRWPVGAGVPTSSGLLRAVAQTENSIGYVGYAAAAQAKASIALLENHAGKFVRPTAQSMQAAVDAAVAVSVDQDPQYLDPPGEGVYPLVSYSYIFCNAMYDDAERKELVQELLRFCLTRGQKILAETGQLPLPEVVRVKAFQEVDLIQLTREVELESMRQAASVGEPSDGTAR